MKYLAVCIIGICIGVLEGLSSSPTLSAVMAFIFALLVGVNILQPFNMKEGQNENNYIIITILVFCITISSVTSAYCKFKINTNEKCTKEKEQSEKTKVPDEKKSINFELHGNEKEVRKLLSTKSLKEVRTALYEMRDPIIDEFVNQSQDSISVLLFYGYIISKECK